MDLDTFETSRLTDYILDDRATSFDCLVEEQESKYAVQSEEEDQTQSDCTNDATCGRPFDQHFRESLGSNYNLETNPPLSESRWPKKEKNKYKLVKPARLYCIQRPGLPDPLRDDLERRMRAAKKAPTTRTEWRQMTGNIKPVTKVVPVTTNLKRKVKRTRRTAPIKWIQSPLNNLPESEAMSNMPQYPSRRRGVVPNRPNRIIQQLHTTQLSSQYPDVSSVATSFDLNGADVNVLDSGQVFPVNWIKIFRPRVVSNLSAANVDVLRLQSSTKPLIDLEVVSQLVKGKEELQDYCTTLCGNANVVRSKNSAFTDYQSTETIKLIDSGEAERSWDEWENHGFYSSTTTLKSDTDLNCSTDVTVAVLAEGIVPEAAEILPIADDEDARVLNLLLEVAKGGSNH